MSYRLHSTVSLIALAAAAVSLASACGPKPPPAPPPGPDFSRNIGYVEAMAATCERSLADADQHFITVMQTVTKVEPDPGVAVDPPGTMIAMLEGKGIDFMMQFDELSGAPIVMDSLTDELSTPPESGKKLKKLQKKSDKFGWMIGHMTNQVEEVGGAYVLSTRLSHHCNLKIPLAAAEMGQVRQQGMPQDQARIQVAFGRLLAVTEKADALAAATTGLIAAYEAAMAGESAEVLDRTFLAVRQSMPIRIQVGKAEIDSRIAEIEARFQQQSYLYQQYASTHGATVGVQQGPPLPVAQLGAAAAEATQLLPQGSVFGELARAVRAVGQGDYQSALGAAANAAAKALASTAVGPELRGAADLVAAIEEI